MSKTDLVCESYDLPKMQLSESMTLVETLATLVHSVKMNVHDVKLVYDTNQGQKAHAKSTRRLMELTM